MTTHFEPKVAITDRATPVFRVEEFARQNGLDEKQKRELLNLFGQFATRQELRANSRMPTATR